MEYSDKVIEHYTNPRNVGKIDNPSGVGEVGNPVCGDIMRMFIEVKDNVITDVKFKTFGCGAAIATSSISTEMIKGKTIEEALSLKNSDVVKKGEVVIEGVDGNEGGEYVVRPSGMVIANTFYEKEMNIKISGVEYKRSGNKDSDIYIEFFGKKIYIKKYGEWI